jgi:signal transduction histidine kinase
MKTTRVVRSMLSRPVAGVRDVSIVDLVIGAALSAYAVVLVSGSISTTNHQHGGIAATIGVLTMTVPVAWRRRAPVAAAAVIAVGAAMNVLFFGHLIRCGPCLPAAFFIAFEVGVSAKGRRQMAGLALVATNVVLQAIFDPRLGGPTVVLFLPITTAFFGLGRLVSSRSAMAAALRAQNEQLRWQREQNAQLAVTADRSDVADNLNSFLRSRMSDIADTAAAGRQVVASDPHRAQQALAAVEHEGRAVLNQMRKVVGSLRNEAPHQPQPALAQLSDLLRRATTADARLTIEGTPYALLPGVELSGYRIVEHLLLALDDSPHALVEVRLCFSPDALELHVAGPPALSSDLSAIVAAARQRAALHGGTVRVDNRAGSRIATARLPLVSGHA